jgi:hypothetical protein
MKLSRFFQTWLMELLVSTPSMPSLSTSFPRVLR